MLSNLSLDKLHAYSAKCDIGITPIQYEEH